jgi:lysophospholipase L1-like esterase
MYGNLDKDGNPIGIANPKDGTLIANYKNSLKSYLPAFNLKLLQVLGNTATANPKIAFMGDSTTFGYYSDGTLGGKYAQSIPALVGKLLNNTGLLQGAVNRHVWWGSSFIDSTNDPRWTLGTGWAKAALGGNNSISAAGATANSAVFQPALASGETYDRVDVYYVRNAGFSASATVTIGGVAQTAITDAASGGALGKVTYSVTATTGTVSIAKTSGADALRFDVIGVVCYKSTTKQIDIYPYATPGFGVTNFYALTGNAWGLYDALWNSIVPDLTIINLTINDINGATVIATYTSQLQAIITKAKTSGECILMTGLPQASAVSAQQVAIYSAVRSLAGSNNCMLIDIGYRWGDQPTSSTYYGADNIHGNAAGYADVARAITNVINDSN